MDEFNFSFNLLREDKKSDEWDSAEEKEMEKKSTQTVTLGEPPDTG